MSHPATRPLSPVAQRILAVTAKAWELMPCQATPPQSGATAQPAPERRPKLIAGGCTGTERRQWPYWPAYPAAAVGWR